MKNMILAYAADWFVNSELLAAAKNTWPFIKDFLLGDGSDESFHTPVRALVREPLKEVYTVPFLSEKFCELLLDEVEAREFVPNPDEDELRQIPEIVLSTDLPLIHKSLSDALTAVMGPVFWELWGARISDIHIQVANYNLRDKKQGAWHHDQSADITMVVPLNTGKYSGGGTEFWGRGIVEPIPTGHALIFPSLTHSHRGLPVTSGDRFLLVFWLKARHGQQD